MPKMKNKFFEIEIERVAMPNFFIGFRFGVIYESGYYDEPEFRFEFVFYFLKRYAILQFWRVDNARDQN